MEIRFYILKMPKIIKNRVTMKRKRYFLGFCEINNFHSFSMEFCKTASGIPKTFKRAIGSLSCSKLAGRFVTEKTKENPLNRLKAKFLHIPASFVKMFEAFNLSFFLIENIRVIKQAVSKIKKEYKPKGAQRVPTITKEKSGFKRLLSTKNSLWRVNQKAIFKITIILGMMTPHSKARADLWGADLPLLVEIVANTLQTYFQLKEQTELMREEYRGIKDKINRLETIKDIIQPDNLEAWKDPRVAVKRLQDIYYTLPPEFRTGKSDEIERHISQAMSLAARISDEAKVAFKSGKQLERNALSVGPAVANKMTASGVGTLISLESQNQVAQATIISLLSNMVAENASRDASYLKSQIREFQKIEQGMGGFVRAITLGGRKNEE